MKVDHRDDFVKMLESNEIMASPLHHRNDTHSLFSTSRRILPGLEDFYGKLVHIPCGWWVTEKDRLKIVDCIKNGWQLIIICKFDKNKTVRYLCHIRL